MDYAINDCCRDEKNLIETERRETKDSNGDYGGPLIVYRCQVCQRRHYVHEVKPIEIGVTLK